MALTLTFPEGTSPKLIYDFLSELTDKPQIVRGMGKTFWDAHKLLSDALVASIPEADARTLLNTTLEKPVADTRTVRVAGTEVTVTDAETK